MIDSPRLTDQQNAALTTSDVSIALSAGAGCGKTFVLTQKFLRALQASLDSLSNVESNSQQRSESSVESSSPNAPSLRDLNLERIVAITFTDRAAREMRNRIRLGCAQHLRTCDLKEAPWWQSILRGLDSARISTIHSFCTTLLRSQSVSAGLDPGFQVMDEATARAIRSQSISDSFFQLLEQRNGSAMAIVQRFGLEQSRSILSDLLRTNRPHLEDERDMRSYESLKQFWLREWNRIVVPDLVSQVCHSEDSRCLVGMLNTSTFESEIMQERQAVILEKLPSLSESSNLIEDVSLLDSHSYIKGAAKKTFPSEEVYEAVKTGFQELRKKLKKLNEAIEIHEEDLETAAEFSMHFQEVIFHVRMAYRNRKREENVLDFNDLMVQTYELLHQNDRIRDRIAEGIDYLLVDEFQDTNALQSDLIRMLCGERFASGTLFLVGDAKQSIYRFRGADPNVFSEIRSKFPEKGRLPLQVNFRSQPAILQFINTLFDDALGEGYEPLSPFDTTQHSPAPSVEFLIANSSPARHPTSKSPEQQTEIDADSETPTPTAKTKANAHEMRKWEAEWIARRVRQMLDDPTPRIREQDSQTGKISLRKVEQKDIVILFRALTNVSLYEEALREHDIEYYLIGGRAFYAQQEVHDWANLFQFLENSADQLSLVGVLRSPFFSLRDDTLFALLQEQDSLLAGLQSPPNDLLDEDQQKQVAYADKVLRELLEKRDRLSLAQLMDLTMKRTGYDAAVATEFLGRRKLANLHKLIDLARDFDQSGLLTMKEFVQQLKDSVLEQTDEALAATHPEESDVVRLMTIHQSKGLEFPVVVVADLNREPSKGSQSAIDHDSLGILFSIPKRYGRKPDHLGRKIHQHLERKADEQESLRLFYVAATRAADHLILSAGWDRVQAIKSPWLQLLHQKFDIESGQLRTTEKDQNAPHLEVFSHQDPPDVQTKKKKKQTKRISWKELPEKLATATPGELPPLMRTVPQSSTVSRKFTLDELFEDLSEDAQQVCHFLKCLKIEKQQFHPKSLPPDSDYQSTFQSYWKKWRNSEVLREVAQSERILPNQDFLLPLTQFMKSHSGEEFLLAGSFDLLTRSRSSQWTLYIISSLPLQWEQNTSSLFLADFHLKAGLLYQTVSRILQNAPDACMLVSLSEPEKTVPWMFEEHFSSEESFEESFSEYLSDVMIR